MNREEEVLEIYSRNISIKEKIRLLEDKVLDLCNEEEAEQENMQPEFHSKFAEGLRTAKNLLRELLEEEAKAKN